MNKDVTLQSSTGDNLYPITRTINVFNANQQNLDQVLANTQVKLTAGTGIAIDTNNVISATGTIALNAGAGITITEPNTISLSYELATAQDIENLFNV